MRYEAENVSRFFSPDFRTIRVEESFWPKKQSCNLSKVDIKKWRLFFDFVCFKDTILVSLGLRKGANVSRNSSP